MRNMHRNTFHGIVPCLLEPNGEAKEFLEEARKPRTQKQYKELLKDIGTRPDKTAKKLREVTWGKKTVDEILSELSRQ